MAFYLIVGRGSNSSPGISVTFSRVPSIVKNQGEEAENLSHERRSRWISAISRADLTEKILENDRVYGRHFFSGKAAAIWDKYKVAWVPTLTRTYINRI